MFSAKFNFITKYQKTDANKLLTKEQLSTLDYVYRGRPYVNVMSKKQNFENLDLIYRGTIFIGNK
jgi:hypothetical protein